MDMVIWGVILFFLAGLVGYVMMLYNGLITLKENIKKAWANIDVILKQRYDELPKLISVCESFAKFEKGILDRLMSARENYQQARSVSEKALASGQISAGLQGIFALAENYPELKTNQNFMQLQTRISQLEETLSDRREFYNDSVNNHNIRIQQIPDVFIANFMRLQEAEMFQVSEAERQDVEIKIDLPKF